MTSILSIELLKPYRVFFPLVAALRCSRVSSGAHMCPLPGRAKVAQTPGRARVKTQYISYNQDVSVMRSVCALTLSLSPPVQRPSTAD